MNHHQPQSQNTVLQRFFTWIRSSGLMRGDDRWVGGVCSGIAARLGWSPTLVRALVIVFTLFFGFGAALYAFGWFLMPDARDGRILGEELFAGRWDWNCLGCFVFFAVALLIPGAGWVCIVLALLALWWLAKSGIRQREGYGFGYRGPQRNGMQRNGMQRNDSAAPYAGGQYAQPGFTPTGAPNGMPGGVPYAPYGSPQSYAQNGAGMPGAASAGSYGSVDTTHAASVNQPTQPPVGIFHPAPATSQESPFMPQASPAAPQTPLGEPQPSPYVSQSVSHNGANAGAPAPAMTASAVVAPPQQSSRRKPAGPIVVLGILGVSCISFAALMGWIWFDDLGIESMVRWGTVWISAVCVLMGIVVVALGIKGRRAGGLIPLGLIAGFCAACMIMVCSTYSVYWYRYTLADRQNTLQTIELKDGAGSENWYGMNEVQVGRTLAADSSDRTFGKLEQGVSFDGDSYDESKAILDLSAWGDTHQPHQVKTYSGKTITSSCPVGSIKVAARSAQVRIILPDGCTYGFGSEQTGYMVGPASVGGKYALVYDTSGTFNFSLDGSSPFPSAPIGEKNYEWMANSPDLEPESGPELLIAVPYAVEGRVNVVYASDWEDYNFRDYADRYGTETGNKERQRYLDAESDSAAGNQDSGTSNDSSKETEQ